MLYVWEHQPTTALTKALQQNLFFSFSKFKKINFAARTYMSSAKTKQRQRHL
jgi:hypothetical protein